MSKFNDLSGQRFSRLLVLERAENSQRHRGARFRCLCECGGETVAHSFSLINGASKSCGCLQREVMAKHNTTHGLSRSSAYSSWMRMRHRCDNPTDASYHFYGGRGITYDPRWNDVEAFEADMGQPPAGMSLDRIDSNGTYCKSNCRWASAKQQANNRRNNRLITYAGLTYTLTQWASITGLTRSSLNTRLAHGWSIERTLTEAVRTKSGLRHSAVIPMGI